MKCSGDPRGDLRLDWVAEVRAYCLDPLAKGNWTEVLGLVGTSTVGKSKALCQIRHVQDLLTSSNICFGH